MSSQVLTTQVLPAWVRLLRAHATTTRQLSGELFAEHGLTINDFEALLHLSHAEDSAMRRIDLAEQLVLTASGVTRLLDGLERAGFVEKGRCESDARVTYAVLTDTGREKLHEAANTHLAQVHALFEERFDRTELEKLAELLGRLPGAAGADGGDCTP